jgi:dienelactone hydrolase
MEPVRLLAVAASLALGACAAHVAPVPQPIERYVSSIDPGGPGPHAAAILVPGCEGVGPHVAFAAGRLASEGFVVLTLDYPAAYGLDGGCDRAPVEAIGDDIARMAAVLRREANVDPARLHLVGWAEGGAGIMAALGDPTRAERIAARSAAAFYPSCRQLGTWRIDIPFLLLLADRESGTSPLDCVALTGRSPGADRVLAIRYGSATNRFDVETPRRFWEWNAGRFDAAIRDAAFNDLLSFLGVPKAP